MAVEQARPTRQSDDEAQPRKTASARRSRADDRAPDTSSDLEESAPTEQDLRQALQEEIGQAIQPVLDELQHQLADAVRRQLEQGLLPTREEIEGEVNEASQPPPRQDQDQVEQTLQSQREGPTEEGGRQLKAAERGAAEQDEATPRSAGILGGAGAVLQATVTRLVNTLRWLLQTVRGLLQTVVSWLGRILAALRDGLRAAVRLLSQGIGAVVSKIVGALLRLILVALRDRLGSVIGKVAGAITS